MNTLRVTGAVGVVCGVIGLCNYMAYKKRDYGSHLSIISSCRTGDIKRVMELIKNGFDPNTVVVTDMTLLMLACQCGQTEIASIFIDCSADINAENKHLMTPFKYACKNGHTDTVEMLMNRCIMTPFKYACKNGHTDTVEMLMNRCIIHIAKGMIMACEYGHTDTVRMLVNRGYYYLQGLNMACKNGHIDIVKIFIEHKVKPTSQCISSACINGHIDIVKLFIDYDIQVITIHHIYDAVNHIDIMMLLLDNGADVNSLEECIPLKYGSNLSIFTCACEKNIDAAVLLLTYGVTNMFNTSVFPIISDAKYKENLILVRKKVNDNTKKREDIMLDNLPKDIVGIVQRFLAVPERSMAILNCLIT
jgi:ankyrin repeat protein